MRNSTKIAPPNSLLFVSDQRKRQIPDIKRGSRIWSTPSCIAVGCLAFMDGNTDVTLEDVGGVYSASPPAFDGNLETPSRVIVVSTVEDTTILQLAVPNLVTRVRIWTNHPTEPDKISIGAG